MRTAGQKAPDGGTALNAAEDGDTTDGEATDGAAAHAAADSLMSIALAVELARSGPLPRSQAGDKAASRARDADGTGEAIEPGGTSGTSGASGTSGTAQFLAALAQLRELRAHIAAWEPDLIDAARSHGASWAELAPALGVASRQAAERRYLRLRTTPDDQASTGDQRVQAERDRRAGQRAVAHWARDHAADLRQLAGQISALSDLPRAAAGNLADLRRALGGDDPAGLLGPLSDTRDHLEPGYPALAARLREIARHTDTVQRGTRARRRTDGSEG